MEFSHRQRGGGAGRFAVIRNPLVEFYRHLHRSYPLFKGCAPCPHRPLAFSKRRSSTPPPFPVDIVYTWVDGQDREHAAKRAAWRPGGEKDNALAHGPALFSDNEELRYSLRSVEAFAPWIRRIFILTDAQIPAWLATEHPKITVADHTDCIPHEYLPTFNSHVIEAYLHCLPGLAEHYIYMNDDFFLSSPCRPEDFFTANGLPHLFMDWRYSRRYGYARGDTPHARSYANTRRFMKHKGYCLREHVIVGHIPYASTKSNAKNALLYFEDAIKQFSPHKFRTCDEMAFYSHCLPSWAYTHKKAVPVDLPFFYINTSRFDRKAYYDGMLKEKNSDALPLFFCLNDVGGDDEDVERIGDMQLFLRNFFPRASQFEKNACDNAGQV